MKELLEILKSHRYNAEAAVCTCSDTVQVGLKCDKQTHPEHLAEMLKPLLAEVWEAGWGTRDRYEFEPIDITNPYKEETE